MRELRVVVIGNGMVGHRFVESLMNLELSVAITVLAEEPVPAYDRVHLSEVFSGKSPDALALTTTEQYEAWGISARFNDPVITIDRVNQSVTTEAGYEVTYDYLVLATGSTPFVPPIPGADHPKCLEYRTLEDLDSIQRCASDARTGVVVGGGLLGLECANALKNLGLQTHVVEFAPGLMGVQLDASGSKQLQRKIEELDIGVHTSKNTQSIVETSTGSLTMNFSDETSLDTDVIVFSAGIRPNDQLARTNGLAIGERGGIVIDSRCQTSDPNIFAVGECALYDGRIFGLVAPGYRMAEAAASVIAGQDGAFEGADMSTKLKLLGVEVGSIGDAHGRTEGSQSCLFSDGCSGVYKKLVISADGKALLGAVLVGDTSDYDTLLQYHLNGLTLPDNPAVLIGPGGDDKPLLSADALPMTATICSCHNVTKGDVIDTIDAGVIALGDIKASTKASTGCGGCAAMLKSLVDDELVARGVEVDNSLCEHFAHTRQELYHIAHINDLKTFSELRDHCGKGSGCDICKPAVASIMASLWNDHILKKSHVGLQDTNDTFMANMQKDGTYSVVPRIPGGEITPDKLLAIGSVAKRFDLYTKITGGQRIDLFGARLDQLPEIWSELINAGFETGHAYGKALRTVKSCVGSTWCRYGVQDSVAMAIYIESRYKGLRSPHKLKSAVSGCTRECAEAQSKDFGVIATEKGWNLFVGGNGGMRPRHADLFATDLDDETLIRYIDRYLMFYIRTADRLQRTSTWLDSLEGGLEYLKQVVIEDSLGIAEELEHQMSHIVGTYQCEWKTALGDPEMLKRFRRFVNSDAPDEGVTFVRERDQIRPARAEEREQLIAIVS